MIRGLCFHGSLSLSLGSFSWLWQGRQLAFLESSIHCCTLGYLSSGLGIDPSDIAQVNASSQNIFNLLSLPSIQAPAVSVSVAAFHCCLNSTGDMWNALCNFKMGDSVDKNLGSWSWRLSLYQIWSQNVTEMFVKRLRWAALSGERCHWA